MAPMRRPQEVKVGDRTYRRVHDGKRYLDCWTSTEGTMLGSFYFRNKQWFYDGAGPLQTTWPNRKRGHETPRKAWLGFLAHQKERLWERYAHDLATLEEAERRADDEQDG